ncbi:MAG TPA: VWA domain-containing protein [Candidatus Angelobacter sp.]|nr:VWA domain-containing protein [Candidatus Angelobacter sp.]
MYAQNPSGQAQSKPSEQSPEVQPAPLPPDIDANDPAIPVWLRPKSAPASTSTAAPAPPVNPAGSAPENRASEVSKSGSGFTFRTHTDEVVLPVTVVDNKQHMVTSLTLNDFQVYEDDQPQHIMVCRREDVPVSIGILVDNSGSMRQKRAAVTKAVVNLVRASNPQDEAFVVNFNDEPYLDQDFTGNVNLLREALDRLDSRGGTALYDAVFAASDHLAKMAQREKKVLLVITDGEDNESRLSLEQAIRSVQDETGPVIYSIGILGSEGKQHRAKRALESLSLQTGGVAFFPKNLDEVDEVSQQVARDIRNQYTIVYKSSNPQINGGYRKVKVLARGSGYKDLQVRTKSGYFAGSQKTAAAR